MEDRIRVSVRGVNGETWRRLKQMSDDEQTNIGRLLTEALDAYLETYDEETEA